MSRESVLHCETRISPIERRAGLGHFAVCVQATAIVLILSETASSERAEELHQQFLAAYP
jgi:hypothetical protein